jgi:adenylate cyclase
MPLSKKMKVNETWELILSGKAEEGSRRRHLFGLIPSNPRCRFCNAPFRGIGAPLMQVVFGKRPSRFNPKFCNSCDSFVSQNIGGAEIELTMLFADVRGSTAMAEKVSPLEFTTLMNRFYTVAMEILVRTDAWIDKIVGDEIIGLYIPGFAGPAHARRAVEAAKELLKATGHGRKEGPWIPLGVGIHTGVAFVGAVGSREGLINVTALGDAMNTAARLVGKAKAGEILASEAACRLAGVDDTRAPRRSFRLKGQTRTVNAYVLSVSS